jgi:hypothetical protein
MVVQLRVQERRSFDCNTIKESHILEINPWHHPNSIQWDEITD